MAFPLYYFRFYFISLILISSMAKAQVNDLAGTITSGTAQAVPDVLVQLLNAKDSSLLKSEFSDQDGRFIFSKLKAGEYLIQTTAAGFKALLQPVVVNHTSTVSLQLQAIQVSLDEVAVVAKQPYVEREKGKLVLNVENSINAEGATAYDLLEKAPSVRIDNNDNISVSGKPGTVVWIDGKPSPLTGQELSNFLRGISSSSIEKIEIISNPSARYDAAGSSIINIKLKKDKRIGTNGSVTLSYLQGVYPKTNNSISFNHRDKKVNVFASYTYAHRTIFTRLKLRRDFFMRDTFTGAYQQDNLFIYDIESHVVRGGADYYINKKNTIGFVVSGQNMGFNRKSDNGTKVFAASNEQSSLFRTIANNRNQYNNYSFNGNFKHVFDTAGTELSSDLDFASYPTTSDQNFDTRYYNLSNSEFQQPYRLHGDLKGLLSLVSLKTDFVKSIGRWKMEAGQKSSYVVADNDLKFFDRSGAGDLLDTTKSNHFIYKENINAAYTSFSRDYKKWSFQAGARLEHTYVRGLQKIYDQNFKRNYAQLFPNFICNYKLNDKNSLEFNYSRRITRPGYEQLNPFKYYIDATAYKVGYPSLKPSTTESFEFSHMYKQKIVTTFGFGRTFNNIIETLAPLDEKKNVTVQTNRNLRMVDVFTLNGSIPVDIKKWWTTASNFNLYYASYNGNIANTTLSRRGNLVFSMSSVNTFVLNSKLSLELSGNYQSREVYAFDVIEPIWSVNFGVQQKLMKGRAILRLNVSDIFYTNKIPATVRYTDYHEEFLVQRDSRVATLSFTYKFGKTTVPSAGRKQGGAEDLKQRANSSTG